jgi:hypothetical protein
MPRQLRCFDYVEDQYKIWALVRHVDTRWTPVEKNVPSGLRFEAGVAFIGKNSPAGFQNDPTRLYEVSAPENEQGLWKVYERPQQTEGGPRIARSQPTRIQMPIVVLVELFNEQGGLERIEQSVTENISRHGASVMTSLPAGRGSFVRITSVEQDLSIVAAVRARRVGPDGIARLHLEFVGGQWPLEGVD